MFGVPSRLGLRGGALLWLIFGEVKAVLGQVTSLLASGEVATAFMTGRAGNLDGFDGEISKEEGLPVNFCDDFLGGGLGGNGDMSFFFFFAISFFSSFPVPLTVELDEDEVRDDSRRDGRPFASRVSISLSSEAPPMRLLVTGGRVCIGLACRSLGVILRGTTMPDDCEDIEVGVVSLL